MSGYSDEQLRRKSHLDNGGTIDNYDRSHYAEGMENEYNYAVTLFYDNEIEPRWTKRFKFALEAVRVYDSFTDWGFANEYATVNLAEPTGKLWTKHLYREGRRVVEK